MYGRFANAFANRVLLSRFTVTLRSARLIVAVDGSGEGVSSLIRVLADDVGVDPESDRGVGVAEAFRNDVDRHPGDQKLSGMDVAQIM